MSRYIDADIAKAKLKEYCIDDDSTVQYWYDLMGIDYCIDKIIPTADVVEADKVQKEIDYWHDKAQSYEQTILKLALNKADVVEVVRCKDCEYWDDHERCDFWSSLMSPHYPEKNDYCSYGERADT